MADPLASADFDAVARASAQRLFGLAFTILRNAAEAEDAVQETLVKAWRHWDDLVNPVARTAWLTRVCVNTCLSSRRGMVRRSASELPDTAAAPDVRANLELEHGPALAALTPEQRAIVALHFGQGYTLDECARLLGCRPGTARSRLGRALDVLRKEMSDD